MELPIVNKYSPQIYEDDEYTIFLKVTFEVTFWENTN